MASIAAAGGATDPEATASGLIAEFGSLGAAAAGSASRQLTAAGGQIGVVAALRTFQEAMEHVLRLDLAKSPVISDGPALLSYLHAKMAWRTTECVRLMHLNSRNGLLSDDLLSEGTVDQAPLYVREVIHRALNLGSTSLIIVHNHPSGDCSPSQGDINLTKRIDEVAFLLGVALLDHIIIGRYGHVSLRQLGLIARA